MTWINRLKLFTGLVLVFVLVAGLTLVFNQRQSQVASFSAAIEAKRYPVGSDYGGTLLESFVQKGDRVTVGQKLFVVQSPALEADLAEGLIKPKTMAYAVTPEGVITVTAAVDGTLSEVNAESGSFVQSGQVLATIDRSGSLFVSADYVLRSRDYARVETGARVEIVLPNQDRVTGRVVSVEVQEAEGQAKTTVLIESKGLVDGAGNGLVARGTPVAATLMLRDDGILAGVGDGFFDFLRRVGV